MSILITGSAGFIGFSLTKKLLELNFEVIGFDNLNNYYDINLKNARLEVLEETAKEKKSKFKNIIGDLSNKDQVERLFRDNKPKIVINLAAQAGVRYSIENPHVYLESNVVGFLNILEGCRNNSIDQLIYASSSSVYGGNQKMPFSESNGVDHPISLYAATKKSNELMAHTYSHLYGLSTTGLRFFTVYGPWGRPDMALFLFTKQILEGNPIKVFNNGNMIRDFTYIDDIVESILRLIKAPVKGNIDFDKKKPDPSISWAPYRIFNIGNSNPTHLLDYIKEIENNLGFEAKKEYLPIQPGDVPSTSADIDKLEEYINFRPKTSIKKGVYEFIKWYKEFYEV